MLGTLAHEPGIRGPEGDAPARGASPRDGQRQRLTVVSANLAGELLIRGQQDVESIEHVGTRILTRLALADGSRNLDHLGGYPAVACLPRSGS